MQLTLTRISIRKVLHGIHLTGTNRNIIISDCHIFDNSGAGIFYDNVNLHQSNITGSHISYNKRGGIVTKGGAVRNLHITGCDIESNMGPEYPPAANVFIDCTGSTSGTAEVAITGCTLQHNGTSPGSSNIRILGSSKPYSEYKKVNWGNVTITGNVLSDTEVNIHLNGCRGVAVSGNTLWKGHRHNMLIEECSDIVMGPNVLDENPPYSPGSKKPGNNIIVKNCEDCTFSGLHIKNVRNHPAAFTIENCNRMNISNCTILDCDNVGLLLRNVTNSRITGFLIHNSRSDIASVPVKVEGGKGNVFDDSIK
jgi:parallel beta-helix repeat protein